MIRRIFKKKQQFFDFECKNVLVKTDRIGFCLQARKLIFLPNGLYLPKEQPWDGENIKF